MAHPASYTMSTGSLPGVKWPGRGADHPPPSNAVVKERKELPILPLWASMPCSGMTFTFTLYTPAIVNMPGDRVILSYYDPQTLVV